VMRECPQRTSRDTKFGRHTRELVAVELFKLEWQQTRWRNRLRDALGCDIHDPLISTFRLFDLSLELVGVPLEADSHCKEKFIETYGDMVESETDIPKYVTWVLKEVVRERQHQSGPRHPSRNQ
jgi:hypothetical protein